VMRRSVFLLGGLVLLSALVAADAAPDPRVLIRQTADTLIAVIKEGKTYFDKDPQRFYASVEKVLDPTIDFDTFSRGVMAVYYKRATPAQRDQFEATFKSGLIRTYGKALLDFGDESIAVLPSERPSKQPDRDSVKMEVRSKEGKIYPVIYSMRLGEDGSWRMYNIIINGINIGLTYRNQFASAMNAPENKGSLDAVINGWGETIAHIDPATQGTPESASGEE
jgi:phospholipid transport system substrate-binding protein